MGFNIFLAPLKYAPQEFGELLVGDAAGGVGFEAAKLSHLGVNAKAARCNLETADVRYREDGGAPTAASGIPRAITDEMWICGQQALNQFRAIRAAAAAALAGLSQAAACVVTWIGHGLHDGDQVSLRGITQADWAALNGTHVITRLGADTFSIAVDTSEFAEVYAPETDPGQILALAKISYTLYF
ncbi:MAG: hypothetical protein NTY36_01275 [Deltaproteobacteria bacterium]|nr:hypothetical protein [Deltaproteobacteria bacterium]